MENVIYLSIILVLLFIIAELFRWNGMYRRINKMLRKQNEDFVKVHADLSKEFVEQFKKYHELSVDNAGKIEQLKQELWKQEKQCH